ncbi:hypothetical protein ISS30_07250 [bacterium]|nr:hypothetical protein [FCB group bacterium]MBL7191476.1 hypothetical protein [bacterium]
MIKSFKINLNKGEGQEEKLARWRRRRESITLTVFFLIFFFVSAFNYSNHKALKDLINIKENKISQIQHQLDELKREGQNVSKDDVIALARLEQTRFLWTKKFRALADVLPEHVAVTALEFNNDEFIVKLIARIKKNEKEFDKISEIMDLLKTTEDFYQDFASIKFDQSHRIIVDGQDILSFSIVSKLRQTISTTSGRSRSRRTM